MADNKPDRNVGQQRYDNLYSGRGNFADPESSSNYTDYSAYNDYSSGNKNGSFLQNAEGNLALAADGPNTMSLGQRERSSTGSSFETTGFDNSNNSDHKERMQGFKKKAAAGGVSLFAFGGLLFGLFSAVSGPMQLIQAGEFLQDFLMSTPIVQQAARSFKTTSKLLDLLGDSNKTDRLVRSRIGRRARNMSNKTISRLETKGVTINQDVSGYLKGGIEVDIAKNLDDVDLTDDKVTSFVNSLGLTEGKYTITDVDVDGVSKKILNISDDLSYREINKVVNGLNHTGKWDIGGYLQTRATSKRLNSNISWLHPMQKLKKAIRDLPLAQRFAAFVGDIEAKVQNKFDAKSAVNSGVDGGDTENVDLTQDNTSASKNIAGETIDSISDSAPSTRGKTTGLLSSVKQADQLLSSPSFNMILSALCLMSTLAQTIGPFKQENIVNVAISVGLMIIGFGSQIKSGRDMDLASAEMATKLTMGDTIDVLDADGKPTGESFFSSFWESKVICTISGSSTCNRDADNVPTTLGTVMDSVNYTSNDTINNLIQSFFGNYYIQTLSNGICALSSLIGVTNLFSFLGDALKDVISNFLLEKTGILDGFMQWIMDMLLGKALDVANLTPAEYGSVGAYGANWESNAQAMSIGGKQLSTSEAIEVNLENRRLLAWKNSQKPLLARLFDPSDYNSSINQVARAININNSSQDFGTQIANVFKAFASAPSIIATASNQLLGGNAYAAATYDFGTPQFAYSVSEMDAILTDDNYDITTNTENVLAQLEKEENYSSDGTYNDINATPYHSYAEQCLGIEIGSVSNGAEVKIMDNENGETWNYIDNASGDKGERCQSMAQNVLPLRIYIMDYFNITSSTCYEGSSDDEMASKACNEMEIGLGDTDTGTEPIASGSDKTAEEWQQTFASETNGVYKGYSTSYNGCTTISVWFVDAHTTLHYGGGNGKDVVRKLIESNPGLTASSTPTKAPAIFSSWGTTMNSTDNYYGHTGLVTAIDEDGTIHTLESGANNYMNGFTSPYSRTFTYTKDQYSSGATFVYVGDYLK